MRILVTNDDGIDADGLHVLARAMTTHGDVVVVAPDSEYSGSSASLGALLEMRPVIRRVDLDGIDEAWSVSGPPALCAIFARLGTFGDPFDLVVSGINPGANVGRAISHSGTVGAVVTGRLGGISGVAVSQEVEYGSVEGQAVPDARGQHWETAAEIAGRAVASLLADPPDAPVILNLNVPNLTTPELKGWRRTAIAAAPIRAVDKAGLVPIEGDPGAFHGSMGWGEVTELPDDTDGGAVEAGYVSVTWLAPIAAVDPGAAADPVEDALESLLSSGDR